MYCAHCGTELASTARFCSGCGQAVAAPGAAVSDVDEPGDVPIAASQSTAQFDTPVNDPSTQPAQTKSRAAGFWVRAGAALIDSVIMLGLLIVVQMGIGVLFPHVMAGGTHPAVVLTLHLFALAYLIGFESSAYQATPGKMVFRLNVTGHFGEQLSLGQATARSLSKYLSGLVLMIGYLMAAFTHNKRALHDMIASTYVIHDPAKVKMR